MRFAHAGLGPTGWSSDLVSHRNVTYFRDYWELQIDR